jgi:hypothetical protein
MRDKQSNEERFEKPAIRRRGERERGAKEAEYKNRDEQERAIESRKFFFLFFSQHPTFLNRMKSSEAEREREIKKETDTKKMDHNVPLLSS